MTLDSALPHEAVFDLLDNVAVHPHGAVPAAAIFLDHFRTGNAKTWSGMALSLPGGGELVLYNDCHPVGRVRATLMEEFFHLRLGHPKTRIRLYSNDGTFRTYSPVQEEEAYASGAAALAPYLSLKEMVNDGLSASAIARRFKISTDLVYYRAKRTKLYRLLQRKNR